MHISSGRGRAGSWVESLENRTMLSAVTPNDPLYPRQPWLGQVSAPQAWEISTGSSKVVVNVNDTGVDYTHPDLYLNIWLNQREIPFGVGGKANTLNDTDADGLITFRDLNARQSNGRLVNERFVKDLNGNGYIDGGDLLKDLRWSNGVDNDHNGYTDDLIGWNFKNGNNDPMDEFGHGTMVAGIIGAVGNNGEGGAGVAWHVQMMATKGAGADGQGMLSTYMPGLRYAADNGARISNASFTTLAPTKDDINQMYNAVDYARGKGVLFVAAAGNDAWNNDHPGKLQAFPASLDLANVISVASNTADDQLAASSNYGKYTVDLAAPGDMVGSTYPVALSPDPTFPYSGGSGTSFAAPHVVGTAALMLARNPGLTYGQLKDLILSNVDRTSAFAGTTVSGGRLNIYRALAAVAPATAGAGAASGGSVFSATLIWADRDLLATAAGGVLA